MASRTELKARLTFWQEALEEQRAAYLALLRKGVKQYRLHNRELTALDLPELETSMRRAEAEISKIQAKLQGRSAIKTALPRW